VSARDLSRGLKELEAESVAFVVCSALGLESAEYSFGYVLGWAGGEDEALRGIKASASRIQRGAAAVLLTFEVAEPVVEAINIVSAGVSVEHWRDVDVTLDIGEPWNSYRSELAELYAVADAARDRVQVIPVTWPRRDARAASDRTRVAEIEFGDASVGVPHGLEI